MRAQSTDPEYAHGWVGQGLVALRYGDALSRMQPEASHGDDHLPSSLILDILPERDPPTYPGLEANVACRLRNSRTSAMAPRALPSQMAAACNNRTKVRQEALLRKAMSACA
jgi:hypothetical protein